MWDVIDLSRWQFALTALYHFLFVPLTLGLIFLLAIMETIYVVTGKTIYRDMTRFWGKLFGINFALGVATGLTMEFQFGTNWSFYSNYVGDIFGAPLARRIIFAVMIPALLISYVISSLFYMGSWQGIRRTRPFNLLSPVSPPPVSWPTRWGRSSTCTFLTACVRVAAGGWHRQRPHCSVTSATRWPSSSLPSGVARMPLWLNTGWKSRWSITVSKC